MTFSMMVYSANWAAVDQGIGIYLNLNNGSTDRMYYGGKLRIVQYGKAAWWEDEATRQVQYEQALRNGVWRKMGVTFTLDETDLPSQSGTPDITFDNCTHAFITIYLINKGTVIFHSPKLEWGDVMTDWAEAPADTSEYTSASLKVTADAIAGTVGEVDTRIDGIVENYDTQFEETAKAITLEANRMIGSTQLMRRTKGMPASIGELGYGNTPPSDVDTSSATLWRLVAPTSGGGTVTIDRSAIGYGEYARWIKSTGNTGTVWAAIHSPLVSLGGSWVGRQVTFSFYVRSPDWTQVDDVLNVSLNLTTGVSAGRLYTTGKTLNKVATVEWAATDGLVHEMALRNGNWRRAAVTFTLNETEIPKYGTHSTSFGSCTHMFLTFYLRKNGEVGFRLPKLEWGAKASDWAEASEDISDSSSARVKITSDSIMAEVDKKANTEDLDDVVEKVTTIQQTDSFIKLQSGEFYNKDKNGNRSVSVDITPEKFSVTAEGSGSTSAFQLDANGGMINELTITGELNLSGNNKSFAMAYTGPANVTVGKNKDYASLADFANALKGKWLNSTVTATLTMASNDPPDDQKAVFSGIAGYGWINLVGDSSARYRMQAADDHATIMEFVGCQNIISISNMEFYTYANTSGNFGIHFANCYFEVSKCVFTGPGVSSNGGRGILANRGARGFANDCEFYDYQFGVLSQRSSEVWVNNSKGNSTIGARDGGRMVVTGFASNASSGTFAPVNQPAGVVTYGTVTVDQGNKPTAPTKPSVSTYALSASDSYAAGNGAWSFAQHDDPMQGFTGGARIKGCMWFASMSALANRTIQSAKIRLYQEAGIGRGGSVPVRLYGTNTAYSGRSSEPPETVDYGVIGNTNPGENTELTIPAAAISHLANGTIKALMIYADDTEVYKGRLYSKNYARFRGSTTGDASTKPLITVTYV